MLCEPGRFPTPAQRVRSVRDKWGWWNWPDQGNNLEAGHGVHEPDKHRSIADVASRRVLNQYQGGMCISERLTMTERTPRHLISPLGPNWVGTDSAV